MGANVCVHSKFDSKDSSSQQPSEEVPKSLGVPGCVSEDGELGEEQLETSKSADSQEMAFNLAVPAVAKDNSLAARGGVRQKVVPLQPGRGLMDWVRLTNKKDLSGTDGKHINVDAKQLAKHASRDDCWMLIQDKVYNMSAYMEFHPGGELELMRAAGTDGTPLFTDIHPWVNYESMLKSCYVGHFVGKRNTLRPCKRTVSIDYDDSVTSSQGSGTLDTFNIRIVSCEGGVLKLNVPFPDLTEDRVVAEIFDSCFRILIQPSSAEPLEITWDKLPKSALTNGFAVSLESVSLLTITFERLTDVKIFKSLSSSVRINPDRRYRRCKIGLTERVTHDTLLCRLDLPDRLSLPIPIGHHVVLRIPHKGKIVERPYTPVIRQLTDSDSLSHIAPRSIYFLIKIYEKGRFTSRFSQMEQGSELEIGDPAGSYDSSKISSYKNVCLLAAGSGFTPMVKMMRKRADLEQKSNKTTTLIFFNKRVNDIIWAEQLDRLQNEGNLKVVNVLSQADSDLEWTGERGRVSKDLLTKYLPKSMDGAKIFVCGPDPFVQKALSDLSEMGVQDDLVHVFQG